MPMLSSTLRAVHKQCSLTNNRRTNKNISMRCTLYFGDYSAPSSDPLSSGSRRRGVAVELFSAVPSSERIPYLNRDHNAIMHFKLSPTLSDKTRLHRRRNRDRIRRSDGQNCRSVDHRGKLAMLERRFSTRTG